MAEPLYYFWGLVVLLAVAAGCNHGLHHVRQAHVAARLSRASRREVAATLVVAEPPPVGVDPHG
jgi:hypothetical protein